MSLEPDTLQHARRAVAAGAIACLALAGCGESARDADVKATPAVQAVAATASNGPIAFQRFATPREDGHTAQIFVRSTDGSVRKITNHAGGSFSPAWSPDGSLIAFARRFARQQRPDQIYTMSSDGTNVRALASGCTRARRCLGDDYPIFSPDGGRVIFERAFAPIVRHRFPHEVLEQASRIELMVVDVKGGAPTMLKRYGRDPQPGNAAARWSPDGKSLVIALLTLKHPTKHARETGAVHVLDADGSAQKRITPWALGAASPDWSPDGGRIVFSSEGGHTQDIYSVQPDGTDRRRLTNVHDTQAGSTQPAWSPDGKQIVFARDVSRRYRGLKIFVMNADGTSARGVTKGSRMELRPAWGPGG